MSDGISFGPYALLRRIARGGMAEVFLAKQHVAEGVDRKVALKRILPHLAEDAEFLNMFEAEARLASQLAHPNIVHVYDFGAIDGYCFISMEHVHGVDCAALIRDGRRHPVPIAYAVRIAADICAGLDYAHRLTDGDGQPLGVVHRDVSPQNILVSFDGVVKLVDFGIAKAAHQLERTRPGIIKGKFSYMSPEQVEGRRLDARSDLFNVGIVLYELLTGVPLFDRENAARAMMQIRSGGWPSVQTLRRDVPEALAQILADSMALDRDRRPSSAGQLQIELEHFLKSCADTVTPAILGRYLRERYPEAVRSGELSSPLGQSPPRTRAPEVSLGTPLIDVNQLAASAQSAPRSEPKASDQDPRSWRHSSLFDGIISSSLYLQRLFARVKGSAKSSRRRAEQELASRDDGAARDEIPNGWATRWRSLVPGASLGSTIGALALALLCLSIPSSDHARSEATPAASTELAGRITTSPSGDALGREPRSAGNAPSKSTGVVVGHAHRLEPVVSALPSRAAMRDARGTSSTTTLSEAPATTAVKVEPAVREAGPGLLFDPNRSPAELQLLTKPAGAPVTLNGVHIATEALRQGTPVPAGRIEIVVTTPGYHDIRRVLALEPGELRSLQLRLQPIDQPDDSSGMLEVSATPTAEVFWAGRKLGATPIAPVRLPPGRHWIVLKAALKPARKIEVTIRAGQITQLDEQL